MLFFLSVRIDPKNMDQDELWTVWLQEAEATLSALEAGQIKSVYKVAGDKRVIGIIDVDSHDDLDRMLMALMPLSANLIIEEISPVREYNSFAEDLKRKWK